MPRTRENIVLLAIVLMALLVSGISPYDHLTWLLEVAPVLIALPILLLSYRRFPLTRVLYWIIAAHALILIVGGHYTYARVPLGDWMREAFGFARNHYDRIGHIAQGFGPAILAREILLRKSPLTQGKWLFFIVTCICLAISAFYEFIEWWAALLSEEASQAFLGTQGDHWDTQWDMFLALNGAIFAQLILRKSHDRQLERLPSPD